VDWQQLATLVIVAVTAGLMWRGWRASRRPRLGAAGACGCGSGEANAGKSIRLSGRKGERPRLTVSM